MAQKVKMAHTVLVQMADAALATQRATPIHWIGKTYLKNGAAAEKHTLHSSTHTPAHLNANTRKPKWQTVRCSGAASPS